MMSSLKRCEASGMLARLSLHWVLISACLLAQGGKAEPRLHCEGYCPLTDRHGDPLLRGVVLRLGSVRFRHSDWFSALHFSPDGKWLAGFGGSIILWDVATGRKVHQIRNAGLDGGGLCPGVFCADGKTLAQVGFWRPFESQVRFFDATQGKVVRQLTWRGLKAQANSLLCLSSDGNIIAVSPDRSDVHFIWMKTGAEVGKLRGIGEITAMTISPDSRTLVVAKEPQQAKTTKVMLWDIRTGNKAGMISITNNDTIFSVAFSSDGQTLAFGTSSRILLYSAASGNEVARLEGQSGDFPVFLFFTARDRRLISGGYGGKVRGWDLATRKRCLTLKTEGPFALSPDGSTLAAAALGESVVRLWDLTTGKARAYHCQDGHISSVFSLAFSPDGRTLVSSGLHDCTLFWDLRTARPIRKLVEISHHLEFFPDGKRLVVVPWGENASLRVWGQDARQPCLVINDPHKGKSAGFCSASLVQDGKHLVTISNKRNLGQTDPINKGCVTIWELETGKRLREFIKQDFEARCLAVTPNGRLAVIGSWDGALFLDLKSGKEILNLEAGEGDTTVALTPDSTILVSATSKDGALRAWETLTGKTIFTLKNDGKENDRIIAISPNSRWAASSEESSLWIWNLITGKVVKKFEGIDSSIKCLAFSPDGSRLAAGLRNSTILILDTCSLAPDLKPPKQLNDRDLVICWDELASRDARQGHEAMWRLVSLPERAIPFLQARLRPASPVAAKTLQHLLRQLGDPVFARRQSAFKELASFEEQAEPALGEELKTNPSLEQRRRIEELLALPGVVRNPDRLRPLRAVQVLERIGNSSAQALLKRLAGGAPESRLTSEAIASLRRLEGRNKAPVSRPLHQ